MTENTNRAKFIILLILTFSILITACNTGDFTVIPLGKMFSLKPSQVAMIANEEITIKFVKVTGDSRCPRDVNCIRAGEVSAEIVISSGDERETLVIYQPGLTGDYSAAEYKNYLLLFDIQPYPEAGKNISGDKYLINMIVQKNQ